MNNEINFKIEQIIFPCFTTNFSYFHLYGDQLIYTLTSFSPFFPISFFPPEVPPLRIWPQPFCTMLHLHEGIHGNYSLWKTTSRSAFRCVSHGLDVIHSSADPAWSCLTWVIAWNWTPNTHRTLSFVSGVIFNWKVRFDRLLLLSLLRIKNLQTYIIWSWVQIT